MSPGSDASRPVVNGTGTDTAEPEAHCSLCGDAAVPARVLEVLDRRTARVVADGCERRVALELVDSPREGEVLLVHQGFAIGRLPEADDPETGDDPGLGAAPAVGEAPGEAPDEDPEADDDPDEAHEGPELGEDRGRRGSRPAMSEASDE